MFFDIYNQNCDVQSELTLENGNVQTLFNLELHLREIRQAKKPDMPCYTHGWSERQCYQIVTKYKEEAEVIDFKDFGVQIAIKFSNMASI